MPSLQTWAEAVLGSQVIDEAPLAGGMSTSLTVVTTASGRQAVLRRYLSPRWSLQRARRAAQGEALALTALADTDVPAPELLGKTSDRENGAPAILMSLCPGRRYRTDDPGMFHQLGRILADIHAVGPIDGLADETAATVQSLTAGQPPRYAAPSGLLELVRKLLPDQLMTRRRVLLHNDFSISNVLVDGGAVTGVVDWTEAGQGNAGADLGFAYVSTVLSFGTTAGGQLMQGYRSRATWTVHDLAWWQLLAASRLEPDLDSWTSSANFLGPSTLSTAEVRSRFNVLVRTSTASLRTGSS